MSNLEDYINKNVLKINIEESRPKINNRAVILFYLE